MGPHMAWKAARFLMRLDIALRRRGYGDEVEATIATLRNLAAKDETRDLVRVFKEHWQVLAARSYALGCAEDAPSGLARELVRDPAYDKALEILQSIGRALKDLWLPRLQLTLGEAATEGIGNPTGQRRGAVAAPGRAEQAG